MTMDEMLLLNESNLPTISNILDRKVVRSASGEGLGDFVADLPGTAKNILVTVYEAILQVIWLLGRNLRLFLSKLFSVNGAIKNLYKRVRDTSNDLKKNLSLINANATIANSTYELPEYDWGLIHETAMAGFMPLPIATNDIPYTIRISIENALQGMENGSGRIDEDSKNRFVQTVGAILILFRESMTSFKKIDSQISRASKRFPNIDTMPFHEIKENLKITIENGYIQDDFSDVSFELIESVNLRTYIGSDVATALIRELDEIEKTDINVDKIGNYFNKVNFDLKKIETSLTLSIKDLSSVSTSENNTDYTSSSDTQSNNNVDSVILFKDTITYMNNILLTLQANKTRLLLDMCKSAEDIINQSNYILNLVNK
ncbi:MAG: hypothetical protein ACRCX2_34280 [Paraclostridium sp.]